MASLIAKTDGIKLVAQNIKTINDQINDAFSDVEESVKRMNSMWEGEACDAVMGKFSAVRFSVTKTRYATMDTIAEFLLKEIGMGYEETEAHVASLADAFK